MAFTSRQVSNTLIECDALLLQLIREIGRMRPMITELGEFEQMVDIRIDLTKLSRSAHKIVEDQERR